MTVEDTGFEAMASHGERSWVLALVAGASVVGAAVFGSLKRVWNPYLRELETKGLLQHGEARSWDGEKDHRREMVARYAWAIPSDLVIEKMVEFSPKYVEIGAGQGYWAKALTEAGAKVYAYDDGSWKYRPVWFDVQEGGPEKIRDHVDADTALLLVWPDYEGNLASDSLETYLQEGGDKLVYVGEQEYGCTANDKFFEDLEAMTLEDVERIPRWYGLNDRAYFYRKKT